MDKFEFHIGSIIELKEEFDTLYEKAQAGHRALVKDIKETEGFLMLYVNWLGETEIPGWTFASHFKFIRDTDEILPKIRHKAASADSEDEYMDRVFQAIDAACESEAFFLLAMKKTETPHGEVLAPELYCVSQNDIAAFLMEAQIMSIASDMFRNVVQEAVEHFDGFDNS